VFGLRFDWSWLFFDLVGARNVEKVFVGELMFFGGNDEMQIW